jgi:hypothetical protein
MAEPTPIGGSARDGQVVAYYNQCHNNGRISYESPGESDSACAQQVHELQCQQQESTPCEKWIVEQRPKSLDDALIDL